MDVSFKDRVANLIDARDSAWKARMELVQPLVEVVKSMRDAGHDVEFSLIRPLDQGGPIDGTLRVPTFHRQVENPDEMKSFETYDVSLYQDGKITIAPEGIEKHCIAMSIAETKGQNALALHVFDGAARNFERINKMSLEDRTFTI